MKIHPIAFLALLLAAHALPVRAQDSGRVSPATLPIPLPSSAPLPPDRLRSQNPWVLPMTGVWRFQLTYGRIKAGQFQPSAPERHDVSASTREEAHPAMDAFDSDAETRWCASGAEFPQWLQADLGKTTHVSGVTVSWEYPTDTYQCRIEGRATADGTWQVLANKTAAPGIGDGPVAVTPADVRYVRLVVTGTPGAHWASVREFRILTSQNGREVAWRPPTPKPVAASAAPDAFAATGYNDAAWHDMPVPSNWEMAGYSLPTYDAVDRSVGLYRRTVNVPASWAGRRIYWHFDGAFDGAEVFVNGQKAGYHESGYTAWDIDLTGLLHPGRPNLFAVRLSKTTPSFDADTGDFQSLGGIYRDTSLIAVPEAHVADITVRTPLDANYKDATLQANLSVQGTPGQALEVVGTLLRGNGQPAGVRFAGSGRVLPDGSVRIAMSAPVKAPALWSAEKPNLYYVVFQVTSGGRPVERVEQRFGFRQVEVKNNIVLWNGTPIKCTGVCRHDFRADRGYALIEADWVQDLTMMKAANINAVRTSHYNHAQRFLELCDEKGMYILDEVPYCWINDQVKDPAYAPYLLLRAQETVARDKNRACVLAWSLGNENPNGIDSQRVLDLVRQTDPTRPAFVSGQDPESIKGQQWKDDHYPGPESIDRFAASTRWGANITEHPHTFYEKEVQDYDPGASDLWSETLIKTWDKLWKAPNILGAFIWEWQGQGIADKNADRTTDFYFGPDHLRQENNKGIVSAVRVPKPELWIVKSAYTPIVVAARTVQPSNGTCAVTVMNHYSFTNLSDLTCRWTARNERAATLQSGGMHVDCAPMQSTTAAFPAPAGMSSLRLEFLHPDGTLVIAFNLAAEGATPPAAPSAITGGGPLVVTDGTGALTVANGSQQLAFDKRTGTLRSWRVAGRDRLAAGGATLNLGQGKAGNERGVYRASQPPVSKDTVVAATPGADGVVHVDVKDAVLTGPNGSPLGTLETTYDVRPDAAEILVRWTLHWNAADTELWEEGLTFALPAGMTHLTWLRDSYFTDYPDGHLGEPSGTARAGEDLFRASKRGLHWMSLTDGSGAGVALLPSDAPLIGRVAAGADSAGSGGVTLFASREVAGPHGLSGSWVADHQIHAKKGQTLTGAFTLRAVDAPALTALR